MTHVAMALAPMTAFLLLHGRPLALGIPLTVVVGFLLLPASFTYNLPVLPPLNKNTVPVILAFFLAVAILAARSRTNRRALWLRIDDDPFSPGWVPSPLWARICFALLLAGTVGTWLTNTSAVRIGDTVLPGLTPRDALQQVQSTVILFMSLFVGWKFLGSERAHRRVLIVLAASGLVLSLPALVEVRLSPQLHNWIYGYFPHSFAQHIRGDGFRPVVFMEHGLELSLYLCMSALAIIAYMRAIDGDQRALYFIAALWMCLILFLSKSFGALLIATALVPVLFVLGPRLQLLAAASIGLLVLCYPLARVAGFSPLSPLLDILDGFAPDRVRSLNFRLENEARMAEKVLERPLFGWGGWGRNEDYDPVTGRNITVPDGIWILQLGKNGFAGFIGMFGLMVFPILVLARRAFHTRVPLATTGLAVVLAANLVDLIPNSGLSPVTWLIAGALLGAIDLGAQSASQTDDSPATTGRSSAPNAPAPAGSDGGERAAQHVTGSSASRYSRFPPTHVRARTATRPR